MSIPNSWNRKKIFAANILAARRPAEELHILTNKYLSRNFRIRFGLNGKPIYEEVQND